MDSESRGLRSWAIKRVPFPQPLIVQIEIRNKIKDFGATRTVSDIVMPLLSVVPSVSTIELPATAKVSNDFTLDSASSGTVSKNYSVLHTPQVVGSTSKISLKAPEHFELFKTIPTPRRNGKTYVEGPKDWAGQHSFDFADQDKCRHGLEPKLCRFCREESHRTKRASPSQRQRKHQVTTLDVFQLLLPFLQPPLEPLLSNPLLFPANRRPYDYQITGIDFLVKSKSALLGDEMGLGKTIQAIIALKILYHHGEVQQTLVLCPRSLLGTWNKEFERWAPELYVRLVRGPKKTREIMWQAPASVYLTTYETFRSDIPKFPFLDKHFQVAILDEIQKIKNPSSGISRRVLRIQSGYKWGLSGTPIENKLEDATSIFKFLKPGLFQANSVLTSRIVKNSIKPYFLRRRTADVLHELPEKVTHEVWLDLTSEQQSAYVEMELNGVRQLQKPNATRMHAFALINQLKQICNIDPNSGKSCKLEYLEDSLEDIVESGQKALVFSHLPNKTLKQIAPNLRSYHAEIFDGSLSDKKREMILHQFQESDDIKVLLMSVQTGGLGLTLTSASHVFHFDHWWNPAIARQAEARAHRIGQTNTVFVHDLYTIDTIEERIRELLHRKQALFDEVIDDLSAEYVETTISDQELFGLFGIDPPETQSGAKEKGSSHIPAGTVTAAMHEPNFEDLSPFEFEEFVARLFEKMGYKTQLTPKTGDKGIDIIAHRTEALGETRIVVQCKHYPGGTVGEPVIRDLIGAWQSYQKADSAALVTSGRFSKGATELATRQRIKLIDCSDVLQLQNQFSSAGE